MPTTITLGSQQSQIYSGSPDLVNAIPFEENKILLIWKESNQYKVCVAEKDGNTLTYGTIHTSSFSITYVNLKPSGIHYLGDYKFLIVQSGSRSSGFNDRYGGFYVMTLDPDDDWTPTFSAETNYEDQNAYRIAANATCIKLDDYEYLAVWNFNNDTIRCRTLSVNSSTYAVTMGTKTTLKSSVTSFIPFAVALANNKFAFVHSGRYAIITDIAGDGTYSSGSDYDLQLSSNDPRRLMLLDGKLIMLYPNSSNGAYYAVGTISNGNEISLGSLTNFYSAKGVTSMGPYNFVNNLLGENRIVVTMAMSTSNWEGRVICGVFDPSTDTFTFGSAVEYSSDRVGGMCAACFGSETDFVVVYSYSTGFNHYSRIGSVPAPSGGNTSAFFQLF